MKIWFLVRLSTLVIIYVLPRFVSEDPSVSSAILLGCFQIAVLLVGAVTFIPSGRDYFSSILGKIEALGFAGLIFSLALAMLFMHLNHSPNLGVLFGGLFVGVPFLGSLSLASIGGVIGIVKAKSSGRPEPIKTARDNARDVP